MQFLYLQSFDRLLTYLCFLVFVTGGLIKLLITVPVWRFTLCLSWPRTLCPNWTIWMSGSLFCGISSLCSHLSVRCIVISFLAKTHLLTQQCNSTQMGSWELAVLFWNIFRAACSLTMPPCYCHSVCLPGSAVSSKDRPLENSALKMEQRPDVLLLWLGPSRPTSVYSLIPWPSFIRLVSLRECWILS